MIKKNDSSNQSIQLLYFLAVYIFYLMILTLSPFEFLTSYFSDFFSVSFKEVLEFLLRIKLYDISNNLFLFIPLGILLFLLFKKQPQSRLSAGLILMIGALVSAAIEFTQLFMVRTSSLVDLVCNICGTWLGYKYAEKRIWQKFPGLFKSVWENPVVKVVLILLYFGMLSFLFSQPLRKNRLLNWDAEFPLIIGNETSMDRPWHGDLFLISAYDRALKGKEIKRLSEKGYQDKNPGFRKDLGCLVLYDFVSSQQDTIHNQLSFVAFDLISDSGTYRMPDSEGIHINGDFPFKNIGPTGSIINNLKKESQFSVEIWFRVQDLDQHGPARILSNSLGVDQRNFMIGQNGRDIHFRVRTPLTGSNGSLVHLEAKDILKPDQIHHLVSIFHHGVEIMYIDGRRYSKAIQVKNYFPILYRLGDYLLQSWALWFLFIFPFGFLLSRLFNRNSFYIPWVGVLIFTVGLEIFYSLFFGQPVDFIWILYSFLIAVFSGIPSFFNMRTPRSNQIYHKMITS